MVLACVLVSAATATVLSMRWPSRTATGSAAADRSPRRGTPASSR
jgi:hypothetical protein